MNVLSEILANDEEIFLKEWQNSLKLSTVRNKAIEKLILDRFDLTKVLRISETRKYEILFLSDTISIVLLRAAFRINLSFVDSGREKLTDPA